MDVRHLGRVGLIGFLAGISILQAAAAASEADRTWPPKGAALVWTKAAGGPKATDVGTRRTSDAVPVLRPEQRAAAVTSAGPMRLADAEAPTTAARSRTGGRPCLSATCPGAMILGTSY